ncbi:hypothetical protein TNCV_2029681 [Trichonephila clavipes]|nr:hypothetical protein TNCV_2029681 [Trichonephila clavipes]
MTQSVKNQYQTIQQFLWQESPLFKEDLFQPFGVFRKIGSCSARHFSKISNTCSKVLKLLPFPCSKDLCHSRCTIKAPRCRWCEKNMHLQSPNQPLLGRSCLHARGRIKLPPEGLRYVLKPTEPEKNSDLDKSSGPFNPVISSFDLWKRNFHKLTPA